MSTAVPPIDLTQRPPRSMRQRWGGLVLLLPALDKGRAKLAGEEMADKTEQVVDTYYQSAYRFAYLLSDDDQDVLAVVVEVFSRDRARFRRLRLICEAEHLIFSRLYLECRNKFKDSPRCPKSCADSTQTESTQSLHNPSAICYRTTIDSIRSLRWELRAPLAFHYITNLSLKEVAQIIGIRVEVLCSRIGEAKGLLRGHLARASSSIHRIDPDEVVGKWE